MHQSRASKQLLDTCGLVLQKRQKEVEKDNEWRKARDKEIRKRRYVLQGQADKHRTKAANASMD